MNYLPQEYQNVPCVPNCCDYQEQQNPSDCNPPQMSAYDCCENSCLNLGGRDCTEYCDSQQNQGDPYGTSDANAAQAGGDCYSCPDECTLPMCSPYKNRRYIQPPRRQSFRPNLSYKRPSIPMANETIYRRSFEGVDTATASCCRAQLINPGGFLKMPGGDFSKETITKMSFQPHCSVIRRSPIKPASAALIGKGPMQGLTTQKHDFVSKFQFRRHKIIPRDKIAKSCACFEKSTIQKMSFIPPCQLTRTKSCKPDVRYKKPDLPMEFETTQKLSFMPICPRPKEDMPWARRASYLPPSLPFAKDTVTKLSFQAPGCFVDDDCCAQDCEVSCPGMPRASC